jgi:hypothetical protein
VARAVRAPNDLIEDACQTAWAILLRAQGDRCAMTAWLRVVAIHEAYRLARRRGVLSELDLGPELLVDFAAEWWERFAKHELAKNTRATYASIWNGHLLPRVGHLQLRQLTPGVVDQLKSDLREDGVGAPTIRKTLSLLQAMLRQAVAWDRLRLDPVKQISKPKAPRQRAVVALRPYQVESLRDVLLAGFVEQKPNKKGRVRDVVRKPDAMSATLVSAYSKTTK